MAARAQHAGAAGLSPSVPAQGWHLLPREASGALGRRTRENQVPRDGGAPRVPRAQGASSGSRAPASLGWADTACRQGNLPSAGRSTKAPTSPHSSLVNIPQASPVLNNAQQAEWTHRFCGSVFSRRERCPSGANLPISICRKLPSASRQWSCPKSGAVGTIVLCAHSSGQAGCASQGPLARWLGQNPDGMGRGPGQPGGVGAQPPKEDACCLGSGRGHRSFPEGFLPFGQQ